MIKILPTDNIMDIYSFSSIESIFIINKVDKSLHISSNKYLFREYENLIKFIKSKSGKYTIDTDDIDVLTDKKLPSEIYILLKLLKKFEENSYFYPNKIKLWHNNFRHEIKNTKSNTIIINLLNKYLGMGHDHSLFYIKDSNNYFLDYQGGSNGYEYDGNLERVKNIDLHKVKHLSLVEALNIWFNCEE